MFGSPPDHYLTWIGGPTGFLVDSGHRTTVNFEPWSVLMYCNVFCEYNCWNLVALDSFLHTSTFLLPFHLYPRFHLRLSNSIQHKGSSRIVNITKSVRRVLFLWHWKCWFLTTPYENAISNFLKRTVIIVPEPQRTLWTLVKIMTILDDP